MNPGQEIIKWTAAWTRGGARRVNTVDVDVESVQRMAHGMAHGVDAVPPAAYRTDPLKAVLMSMSLAKGVTTHAMNGSRPNNE